MTADYLTKAKSNFYLINKPDSTTIFKFSTLNYW